MKVISEYKTPFDIDVRIVQEQGKLHLEYQIDGSPLGAVWERHKSYPATGAGFSEASIALAETIESTARYLIGDNADCYDDAFIVEGR